MLLPDWCTHPVGRAGQMNGIGRMRSDRGYVGRWWGPVECDIRHIDNSVNFEENTIVFPALEGTGCEGLCVKYFKKRVNWIRITLINNNNKSFFLTF